MNLDEQINRAGDALGNGEAVQRGLDENIEIARRLLTSVAEAYRMQVAQCERYAGCAGVEALEMARDEIGKMLDSAKQTFDELTSLAHQHGQDVVELEAAIHDAISHRQKMRVSKLN